MTVRLTKKQIANALVNAWMNGVAKDDRIGLLWKGEASVVCSLAHHFRIEIADKDDNLRLWHQVYYRKLRPNGRGGLIDLIICRVAPIKGVELEYMNPDTLPVEKHLVAIELKYARTVDIAKDFEKLGAMRKQLPGILVVFCYVDYSGIEPTPELKDLKRESLKHEIPVFYGNTGLPLKWKILNKKFLS